VVEAQVPDRGEVVKLDEVFARGFDFALGMLERLDLQFALAVVQFRTRALKLGLQLRARGAVRARGFLGGLHGREGGKSEGRNPKAERRPKSEGRRGEGSSPNLNAETQRSKAATKREKTESWQDRIILGRIISGQSKRPRPLWSFQR
jgi:hypothetical protein